MFREVSAHRELSRALFCTLLPNRMAVFICASDESEDQNPRLSFFYGGFAATVAAWESLAGAWTERVLDGPPAIPYLHMTEIRSPKWREAHGLSLQDAERRVDEAVRVIRSTGGLVPVCLSMPVEPFDRVLKPLSKRRGQDRARVMERPDYLCFLGYIIMLLDVLWHTRQQEVSKVDFWVEQNDGITENFRTVFSELRYTLEHINRPELVPLLGEMLPVSKERIPVQAADVLCWHARNAANRSLDRTGLHRYWKMVNGRDGFRGDVPERMMLRLVELPELPRPGGADSKS